jgi:hypothetical protein
MDRSQTVAGLFTGFFMVMSVCCFVVAALGTPFGSPESILCLAVGVGHVVLALSVSLADL